MVSAFDEAGFAVEVVTAFPTFPDGKIDRMDRVVIRSLEATANLRVTRLFTYASRRLSGRVRIMNWLSVSLAMAVYVFLTKRRYDFVLVTMPPITLALPALLALLRHKARLITDVRDVFPDVAIKMGYWREGSAVVRIVGAIAAALYRASELVLCVTRSAYDEVVARGSESSKTIVAANGFDPIEISSKLPYVRGDQEFVAAFVGNMGLATGLDIIVDAAQILRSDQRIRFVLAGGGADRERLAARISDGGLTNVSMLGVIARDAANALIASADVSIVPLHPAIVDSLPTKIFDALLLGCPVICCANGEASSLVEKSGGGIVVPPTDGEALAAAMLEMASHPERKDTYASAGRAYIADRFDRTRIMRDVAARVYSSWASNGKARR